MQGSDCGPANDTRQRVDKANEQKGENSNKDSEFLSEPLRSQLTTCQTVPTLWPFGCAECGSHTGVGSCANKDQSGKAQLVPFTCQLSG